MSQLLNQIDYGIWRSVGSVNCTFKFNLMVYNHNDSFFFVLQMFVHFHSKINRLVKNFRFFNSCWKFVVLVKKYRFSLSLNDHPSCVSFFWTTQSFAKNFVRSQKLGSVRKTMPISTCERYQIFCLLLIIILPIVFFLGWA